MKLSIGEMSKLNDVSIHTLRYYDKIKLLIPSEIDEVSGYRYYDYHDCDRLDKIKMLKTIGLSLGHIKKLMTSSLAEIEDYFLNIRKETDKQLYHLSQVKRYLDDQIEIFREYKTNQCYSEPAIVHFKKRYGFLIHLGENPNDEERIKAVVDFEKRKKLKSDVYLKPSRLMKSNSQGGFTLDNYLAIIRDTHYFEQSSQDMIVIEEGAYAIIDHLGGNGAIETTYDKANRYINELGMKSGDRAYELIVIGSNITDRKEEWRVQIQIPLKKM